MTEAQSRGHPEVDATKWTKCACPCCLNTGCAAQMVVTLALESAEGP